MTNSHGHSETRRPPFLVRLILALIKLIVLVLIVGGGVALGVFAVSQFSLLNARQEAQKVRLDNVSREMQDFITQQPNTALLQGQTVRLETKIADLEDSLNILRRERTDAAAAMETQAQMMEEMATQLETTLSQTAVISQSLATLEDTVGNLGETVSANSAELATVSGTVEAVGDVAAELDAIQDQLAILSENLSTLQTLQAGIAASPDGFVPGSDVLGMFRVWGLLTRARIYLAEDNVGFARTSIEAAQSAVDAMVGDGSAELASVLEPVQAQIAAAAENLSSSPQVASRNLDSALESLDLILSASISEAGSGAAAASDETGGGTVLPITPTPESGG